MRIKKLILEIRLWPLAFNILRVRFKNATLYVMGCFGLWVFHGEGCPMRATIPNRAVKKASK